jgi:exopolysaccharide biosynthesis polyprenyl glycosylphosphotransferase
MIGPGLDLAGGISETAGPEPREAAPAPTGRDEQLVAERWRSATVTARDSIYRRLLALADVLAAAATLILVVPVLGDDHLRLAAIGVVPLVIGVSKIVGLYDRDPLVLHKSTLDEAPSLFRVATFYTFVFWLAQDVIVNGYFGRDQLLTLWMLLFALMLTTRTAARRLARALSAEERCLIVGDAASADWVRGKLAVSVAVKASVVARISFDDAPEGLETVVARHGVDRVIVVPGHTGGKQVLSTVGRTKALGVRVSLLPRLLEVVGSSVEFDELDGITLMGVRRHGLSRSSRALKRAVDIAAASLGLLLLAPVLPLVALAIKLDSRGPVFFRQRRMGRAESVFEMLKFRTMVRDADQHKLSLEYRNEAEGLFKIVDDPRITRVGGLLRRSSLDELPQLFNVLKGEMSLVGPRPLVIEEDRRVEGWQRRRLLVRPGITGLWQIFGSARIPLFEMVKIDYLYGANWSLWLDVKILLRTVQYVFARRGL